MSGRAPGVLSVGCGGTLMGLWVLSSSALIDHKGVRAKLSRVFASLG